MVSVLKNNMWCGNHIYFDDEGREIKKFPYIDPYIKNTGVGSFNLWCGNHIYFDDESEYQIENNEEDYDLICKTRDIFDIDTNEKITEVYTEKVYNLE